MEEFEQCLRQLRESVRDGVRDHSLAAGLRRKVEGIRLEPRLVQPYCQGLFSLYDLSNSAFFVTRPPNAQKNESIVLDPLSILLKSIVLKMLGTLVAFFNDNPEVDLPHSLLSEALEIMVLVSRVLLDLNQSAEVKTVYPLVVTFREAVGPVLAVESELAHLLNVLQLYELDVDSRRIDVGQYKKTMQDFQHLCKSQPVPEGYLQLGYSLTLQVILKLLKRGSSQQAKTLVVCLPQKMKDLVGDLTTIEPKLSGEDNGGLHISPYYQLYLQIKSSGVSNIAEENLRIFIEKEEHFHDPRLFDVVALTGYMLPLEIWFEIHLNSKGRNQQVHLAYKCFLYMVDIGLEEVDADKPGSLSQQWGQKEQILASLVRLARVVMISLLSQKKDAVDPVVSIVKRLSKLLVSLVLSLHPNPQQIQQFSDKLQLLCNKYGLNDMTRSVTCITFYYQLIMGTANEQSYSKFYKTNILDKGSELFKILKLAYEYRIGKEINLQEESNLLKKEPFIMLLFANDPQEQLILHLPPQEFAKIRQKWEAYALLLHGEETPHQPKLNKLLMHIEETICHSEFDIISKLELGYIENITQLLQNLLNEDKIVLGSRLKAQIALVLMYLISIQFIPHKLAALSSAIQLNRYSKLQKIINLAQEEFSQVDPAQRTNHIEHFLYLAKLYMCNHLETAKIQYLQGEVSAEAGLLVLIDLLNDFLQKYEANTQARDFFRFVRFQLMCLYDSVSESEINFEQNAKLLKFYCSSRYIKKQMKLKIMRRLIREALVSDSKLLTLEELSQLISIAEDHTEKKIFASYILRTFGEEGKMFLMLQSSKDPKGFGFLLESFDED